jgi:hypothetical protein
MLKFLVYIPQIADVGDRFEDIKGYGFVEKDDAMAKAKEYGEILNRPYRIRNLTVFTKSIEAPIHHGEEYDDQY